MPKDGFVLSLLALLIAVLSAGVPAREAHGARAGAPISTSATRTYIYPTGSYRWFSVKCGPNPSGWGVTECDATWFDPIFPDWALHLNRRTWVNGMDSVRAAHFQVYARRQTLRLWKVPRRAAGMSTTGGENLSPTPEDRKEWLPVFCGLC